MMLSHKFIKGLRPLFMALLLAALAFSLMPAMVAEAAQRTVTSTLDDGSAGTLRYEINNALPDDEIIFSVTGMITLISGELLINKNLTITGPGANSLIISGGNSSRVFNIASGNTVTISNVTITGGKTAGEPGGGVYNLGDLTLTNCTVSNNITGSGGDGYPGGPGGSGGGIYNEGELTLNSCIVSDNTTGKGGGSTGWYTGEGGPGGSGGGIYNEGELTLNSCTVSDNISGVGGDGAAI